jgi:hypothetical protein
MEGLIKNIQESRNKAMPTLYLGALQMNTDQYFMPNDLHNQDFIPAPPPKIFKDYGATVEIDRREYAMVQPQVPRNPEQEALNEYFSRQRVKQFATGQAGFLVQEQLTKQAELLANQLVRDEVDRRSGIRKAVLEATGLTPAQIQQQMATEGLAGINPRLIDIRERQVQDAVNLYYNQNNIPVPITTPFEPSTNIAPTVPQEARELLPLNESEAGIVEDQGVLSNVQDIGLTPISTRRLIEPIETTQAEATTTTQAEATTTTQAEPTFASSNVMATSSSRDGVEDYALPYPTASTSVIPRHIYDIVNNMTTDQLIDYIYSEDITDPMLLVSQGAGIGNFKTRDTLTRKVGRQAMLEIVARHMASMSRVVNNDATSSSLQKY